MFTSKILPEGYNEDEPPDSSGDNPKVLDLEVELKVLGFNDFQEALNVGLSFFLSFFLSLFLSLSFIQFHSKYFLLKNFSHSKYQSH